MKLLKEKWAIYSMIAAVCQIAVIVYNFNRDPVTAGRTACSLLFLIVICTILYIGKSYDEKHKSENDDTPVEPEPTPPSPEPQGLFTAKSINLFVRVAMLAFVVGMFSQPFKAKEISAREFKITDKHGRVCALFDCVDGTPRLVLMDAGGRTAGQLSLAKDTGDPTLMFYDFTQRPRAGISVVSNESAGQNVANIPSGGYLTFLESDGQVIQSLTEHPGTQISVSH